MVYTQENKSCIKKLPGQRLWSTETYERVPWEGMERSILDKLLMKCVKWGRPSPVVVDWRTLLKIGFVLAKDGHFQHRL